MSTLSLKCFHVGLIFLKTYLTILAALSLLPVLSFVYALILDPHLSGSRHPFPQRVLLVHIHFIHMYSSRRSTHNCHCDCGVLWYVLFFAHVKDDADDFPGMLFLGTLFLLAGVSIFLAASALGMYLFVRLALLTHDAGPHAGILEWAKFAPGRR